MPKKLTKNSEPKKRTTSKASPSAIEVEKTYRLQNIRISMGWSWFELSFMIGKDNRSYVRDVENPLHTLKYDPADVNYIALILDKTLSVILPPSVQAKNYNLRVVDYPDATRRTVYEISVLNAMDEYVLYHTFTQERKEDILPTPLKTFEPEEVKSFIDTLIDDGFFNAPKTALDVQTLCRKHFGKDFHPRHMIKTLIDLCDGRKGKKLNDDKKNDCGRKVFLKPYNFDITSDDEISSVFKAKEITDFIGASNFVRDLPYRRNKDKNNSKVVLIEQCGTCSTKHALLKRLADENGHTELTLALGIYKMNGSNTPATDPILKKHNLNHIPEAHNYLRVHGCILDLTGLGMSESKLASSLLTEIEITPEQIADFKVCFHQDYLDKWLVDEGLPYSLDETWRIREECIREIARKQCELNTGRLTMRPFSAEDGAMMYALNEDTEVLQYTGDRQFADVDAATIFLRDYDQYEKYGVGRFVVILKENGETLGWCGLKYHTETGEYDIGYRFFKQHWGKGYATESAKAAMEYGFGVLKLNRIIGRARVENQQSINVFNKLGMRFVEPYTEDGKQWVLYETVRELDLEKSK